MKDVLSITPSNMGSSMYNASPSLIYSLRQNESLVSLISKTWAEAALRQPYLHTAAQHWRSRRGKATSDWMCDQHRWSFICFVIPFLLNVMHGFSFHSLEWETAISELKLKSKEMFPLKCDFLVLFSFFFFFFLYLGCNELTKLTMW